nr:hypothetical protein [Tanacetum cinerariifolium]
MLFNNTMKWIEAFVPMDTELVNGSEKAVEGSEKAKEGSSKREGILEDDDDVTIKATPLSSKSPTIVDYKIYKEGRKSFFKIIREDGNSQSYLTLGKMFKNFNREDLEVLWTIVKKDVRLQVNYEVEMVYDLLRLIRRQINEGYVPE